MSKKIALTLVVMAKQNKYMDCNVTTDDISQA